MPFDWSAKDNLFFYSRARTFHELSNFHESPFELDGREWKTVEHFFQAAKFASTAPEHAAAIAECATPAEAKRLGGSRRFPIHANWDQERLSVMRRAVAAKFAGGGESPAEYASSGEERAYRHREELRELLLSTGDRVLVEDASNDGFWGRGRNFHGQNMLGVILMETRTALREQ